MSLKPAKNPLPPAPELVPVLEMLRREEILVGRREVKKMMGPRMKQMEDRRRRGRRMPTQLELAGEEE